jgi:hypothetical protein
VEPVDRRWKATGWVLVGALNLFFAFYVLLFAIRQVCRLGASLCEER